MKQSKIEWTDATFNPWWGCEKVSPGCANCYAETFAKRTGNLVWGGQSPRRFFKDAHWNEPLKWNHEAYTTGKRKKVFCASMADVFEDRPDLIEPRKRLGVLIGQTPYLDWLLLTKRPENMLNSGIFDHLGGEWPANVWAGTSVENQAMAIKRIPELSKVPARIRFLSCEPLVGPLQLGAFLDSIHWVITGGESGAAQRPYDPEWGRSILAQCQNSGVPFFFKQLGGFPDKRDQMEDFPEDLRVREWPK